MIGEEIWTSISRIFWRTANVKVAGEGFCGGGRREGSMEREV